MIKIFLVLLLSITFINSIELSSSGGSSSDATTCNIYISNQNPVDLNQTHCGSDWVKNPCKTLDDAVASCKSQKLRETIIFNFDVGSYQFNNQVYCYTFYNQSVQLIGQGNSTIIDLSNLNSWLGAVFSIGELNQVEPNSTIYDKTSFSMENLLFQNSNNLNQGQGSCLVIAYVNVSVATVNIDNCSFINFFNNKISTFTILSDNTVVGPTSLITSISNSVFSELSDGYVLYSKNSQITMSNNFFTKFNANYIMIWADAGTDITTTNNQVLNNTINGFITVTANSKLTSTSNTYQSNKNGDTSYTITISNSTFSLLGDYFNLNQQIGICLNTAQGSIINSNFISSHAVYSVITSSLSDYSIKSSSFSGNVVTNAVVVTYNDTLAITDSTFEGQSPVLIESNYSNMTISGLNSANFQNTLGHLISCYQSNIQISGQTQTLLSSNNIQCNSDCNININQSSNNYCDKPVVTPTSAPKKSNKGLEIGLIVGGVAIGIIIFIVIIIKYHHYRKRHEYRLIDDHHHHHHHGGSH